MNYLCIQRPNIKCCVGAFTEVEDVLDHKLDSIGGQCPFTQTLERIHDPTQWLEASHPDVYTDLIQVKMITAEFDTEFDVYFLQKQPTWPAWRSVIVLCDKRLHEL